MTFVSFVVEFLPGELRQGPNQTFATKRPKTTNERRDGGAPAPRLADLGATVGSFVLDEWSSPAGATPAGQDTFDLNPRSPGSRQERPGIASIASRTTLAASARSASIAVGA